MRVVEVSGRTVDEAVERALDQLGLGRDQVDVDVIRESRKGLLGFGAEEAIVRATAKDGVNTLPTQRGGRNRPRRGGGGGEGGDQRRGGGGERGGNRRDDAPRDDAPREESPARAERPADQDEPETDARGKAQAAAGSDDERPEGGQRRRRRRGGRGRGRSGSGSGSGGEGRGGEGRGEHDNGGQNESRRDTEDSGESSRNSANQGGGRRQSGGRDSERTSRPRTGDTGPGTPVPGAPDELPTTPPDDAADAIEFTGRTLRDVLSLLGLQETEIVAREPTHVDENDDVVIEQVFNIEGEHDDASDELGVLIGRRGETMSSLQYLLNVIVSSRFEDDHVFAIDIEGYRQRREDSLVEMAEHVAAEVHASGDVITLEPMPASDRRIIHLTLRSDENVVTESVGSGPDRQVEVLPASLNEDDD